VISWTTAAGVRKSSAVVKPLRPKPESPSSAMYGTMNPVTIMKDPVLRIVTAITGHASRERRSLIRTSG
jgi:hypothetical protein